MQLVKIPAKHYVGLANQKNRVALGFMTPDGDDAAAGRRKETVDAWVGRSSDRTMGKLNAITLDNAPMVGFKMTADIRSSRYGGDDKWRIEDPRGFELEISSGNLAQLLAVGVIDKGEIKDACVWARAGNTNILLSIETEEYKNAVENTRIAQATASWKDVKIGNTVVLQNGTKGVYYGKMFLIGDTWYPSDEDQTVHNKLVCAKKATHVIVDVNENGDKVVYTPASPKLAEIRDAATVTEREAEEILCQIAQETYVSGAGISSARFLTYKRPAQIRFELVKLDMDRFSQVTRYFEDCRAVYLRHRKQIFCEVGSNFGAIGDGYGHRPPALACYHKDWLAEGLFAEVRDTHQRDGHSAWYTGSRRTYTAQRSIPLDDQTQSQIDDFYQLVAHVETSTGAQLSAAM